MRKHLMALVIVAFAAVGAFGQDAPSLRIVTEDPNLPSELYYGNIKIKPLRLRPGTNTAITINDTDFFVQQQYIDFLNRFPDAPGLSHWMNQITLCSDPAGRIAGMTLEQCVDYQRTNTSGAFFLSPEFQYTGYYIYRLYKGGLGRMPLYADFMPEVRQVASGIIVNSQLSAAAIEANRTAFANAFVQRGEFTARYSGMSNQQYVDALFQTTGINASAQDRAALVNGLTNGTETRASVLRKIVDGVTIIAEGNQQFNTTYGKAFYDQEYNPAFVLMEYFGYLRRDPDTAGFNFWLGKLNHYGNFKDAEMVRSFLVSPEYNARF